MADVNAQHLDEQGDDGLIRVRLPRGIVVVLTPQEFARAVQRGKTERRAAAHAHRTQQMKAREEAQALGWISAP